MSDVVEREGILVGGKYRVKKALGAGGMGAVYSGVDEELGGPVAVKFLHRQYGRDPSLRARFRREAQALSRLRHPGVVSLLDFGEHDDEPFVVMELVTGKPLEDLIDAGRPLALPFIVTIFVELLAVLEFTHEAGVVHRDVKPSNVMVLPGDRVKLIDFGLVLLPEAQEKLTIAGIAHGTPEYMSPEQAQGDPIEPPSDIYSTGVLLYESICGKVPFEGASAAVLMSQHLFVEPPLLKTRGHKRDVPKALESIVRRAMAKRAHERPTAGAMRAELLAFLKGTDAVSLTDRGVEARQRDASLDREERALTNRPRESSPDMSASARVTVDVRDPTRAAALRSALGASGIATPAEGSDEPTASMGARIVSAMDDLGKIARDLPILVVDVTGVDGTVRAIRAGASDIALTGTSDSRIAAQVARLLRRKR